MLSQLAIFKQEFSDRTSVQFNNAGMAPISRSVSWKVSALLTENQFQGSLVDHSWLAQIKETRADLARFLGAAPEEIAFVQNCAIGLSQAALGFPLRAGDEVVVLDQEYASNFYPWKVACEKAGARFTVLSSGAASGADFGRGDVLTSRVLDAIRPGVKIVALSWVQFQTGAMLDLRTIGEKAHSVGAFLVVDAIQGLGQLPFSFRDLPVDFVVGGSHKWMCSLNGQGFLAAKKEFLDLLFPTVVGCGTFNRFSNFADPAAVMEKSARKFEPGGFAFIPLFAFREALAVLERAGMDVIAKEIFRLSRELREQLKGRGIDLVTPMDQSNGFTSFRLPLEREVELVRRCREEGIAIAKRGEFVRLSLHAYASEDEINRFLQVLG